MNTIGFRRRLSAFLIDSLILSALTWLIFLIASFMLDIPFQFPIETGETALAFFMTDLLLPIFYFVYFHGSTGQTPGKSLLRIKVAGLSGEPISYGTAFLRWVGYILSALPAFAGFIWIIFDGKKQGWHDKIAQTVVIPCQRSQQTRFDFTQRFKY